MFYLKLANDILKGIQINHVINHMICPVIASFYDIIFSFTCQFSQKHDFHIILDGDDPSPQVAIVSQPSKCLKFMTFRKGCSVKDN